jgi:hypothetical protein
MNLLKSIALSLVASAAATYLLGRLLSADAGPSDDRAPSRRPYSRVVVIVPVFTGNSNNHIWHIERRGLFGR